MRFVHKGLAKHVPNSRCDPSRLRLRIRKGLAENVSAYEFLMASALHLLRQTLDICGNYLSRGFHNPAGRAEVLGNRDCVYGGISLPKVEYVVDVGAPKLVQSLVVIPNNAQVRAQVVERAYEPLLERIDI